MWAGREAEKTVTTILFGYSYSKTHDDPVHRACAATTAAARKLMTSKYFIVVHLYNIYMGI